MNKYDKRVTEFLDPKVRERFNKGRPPFCNRCPIGHVTLGYVPPLKGEGSELIVGEAAGEEERWQKKPFIGGAGGWLNSLLRQAGLVRRNFSIVNVLGCQPPLNIFPSHGEWTFTGREAARAAVDYCFEHHCKPMVDSRRWTRILALGNEALRKLTPRSGITLWRGSPLPLKWKMEEGPKVVGCLHPAALMRDSRLFSLTATKDFRRLADVPPENYNLTPSVEEVEAFEEPVFSFDFEWDMKTGEITLCGLSAKVGECLVVPFVGPYIPVLKRIFEQATELIGHNIIGADTRYFEQLGWKVEAKLVDTMLIQHLVQPDMLHGLGFVGTAWTNKVFWKGKPGEYLTWNKPSAIPREFGGYGGCISEAEAFALYNARDTDGTLQAARPLEATLDAYGMRPVYENVSTPLAFICREMTAAGLKIDHSRLKDIRDHCTKDIERLENELPEGLRPYTVIINKRKEAPPKSYKSKTKICKGSKKEGTSHEPVGVVFLGPREKPCPVCGRVLDSGVMHELKFMLEPGEETIRPWNSPKKIIDYVNGAGLHEVIDSKTGSSKTDKSARKVWARKDKAFLVMDELKKASTLKASFAKEGLLSTPRVYFSLKVHGTSEGRLSSSGARKGLDPNIQNQPKIIRKMFVPDDPSFGFLNLDIIQGENMLTAFLAKDIERLRRLRTPGYDEHSHLASLSFGLEVSKDNENARFRKPGKVINHGMNYGLGERKALEYVHAEGFTSLELRDVRKMREAWASMNVRTAEWQKEVVALVKRQSFLANPFGRKRWFQGRNYATKSLAFLPASTLADVVLRMMIALHANQFMDNIKALGLGVYGELPEGWRLSVQVHDSLVLQGPDESWKECAAFVERVMIQPWHELDGFQMGVETEYSGKGGAWGDCKVVNAIRPWLSA